MTERQSEGVGGGGGGVGVLVVARYDVTQDVLVPSGTWHYRVLAETDAGEVVGPDQVVVVP